MARAGDTDISEQIKNCFREFDKDGNGAITRGELQNVLKRLCRPGQTLTSEEIDKCVEEADKNENGVIEYEEFVDWLMKPGARVQASKQGAALFDFEAVIKPLFDVFDRNGNSLISSEEFEECFLILQNAMRLSNKNKNQPALLEGEAADIFEAVGGSEGSGLDFAEFVSWQRRALEKSGLLSEDLKDLVPALARQLQRIFRLSEAQEKGELKDEDTSVLTRIIDNIGSFSANIWNEEYAAQNSLYGRKHYTNRWSDPPVGVNIERLLRRHLQQTRMKPRDYDKYDLQVFCMPENVSEKQDDLSQRRWIARISQGYVEKAGEESSENTFDFYIYADLKWVRQNAEGAKLFKEAHDNFSDDMRFYCLLKTQANFGISMTWDMVQTVLKNAVSFGLMPEESHKKYNESFESQVLLSLKEEGILSGLSYEERQEKLHDTLYNNFKVATRSVMGLLIELEIFRVSSKLADLLGS